MHHKVGASKVINCTGQRLRFAAVIPMPTLLSLSIDVYIVARGGLAGHVTRFNLRAPVTGRPIIVYIVDRCQQ